MPSKIGDNEPAEDNQISEFMKNGNYAAIQITYSNPGVNVISILLSFAFFLYESVLRSFSLVTVWLCNFYAKEY